MHTRIHVSYKCYDLQQTCYQKGEFAKARHYTYLFLTSKSPSPGVGTGTVCKETALLKFWLSFVTTSFFIELGIDEPLKSMKCVEYERSMIPRRDSTVTPKTVLALPQY